MSNFAAIPVPYTIARNPAPTYQGGPDGRSATMTFQVGINDVTAFVQHAIHSLETIDFGGGVTAARVVPLVYPDDTELHLIHYDVEYFGTPGGSGAGASIFSDQFSHARLRCEFGAFPFAMGGDTPFFTLTTDHSATMETLPGSALTFPSGIGRTTGDWGLPVGTVAYNLTTYMGTTHVSPTISAISGKVNNAAFTVTGVGTFPAGTLRLMGIRSEYAVGMFSRTMVKSFGLAYRDRPWNQVLNPVGVWETPTLGSTGLTKYSSTSFDVLKSA